jgi:hypothetical protein
MCPIDDGASDSGCGDGQRRESREFSLREQMRMLQAIDGETDRISAPDELTADRQGGNAEREIPVLPELGLDFGCADLVFDVGVAEPLTQLPPISRIIEGASFTPQVPSAAASPE